MSYYDMLHITVFRIILWNILKIPPSKECSILDAHARKAKKKSILAKFWVLDLHWKMVHCMPKIFFSFSLKVDDENKREL